MNKFVLLAVVLAAVLGLPADEEKKAYDPAKDRPTTPEEVRLRKEWIDKRRYEHFGGELVRPGSLKGEITVVNCQRSVDVAVLEESVAYLRKETNFAISIKEGTFSFPQPSIKGTVSLFVVEDEKMPSMLLAPENKWALLNITPLKTGRGSSPAFLKARVLKEMSRVFAGLCGAISSNYPGSLTTGIYDVNDLDRQEDHRLSVDVIARMAPSLAPIGVAPAEMTTYRAACKQGWASSPTNEVQRKIWDEVRAIPDQPLRIKKQP